MAFHILVFYVNGIICSTETCYFSFCGILNVIWHLSTGGRLSRFSGRVGLPISNTPEEIPQLLLAPDLKTEDHKSVIMIGL